MKDLIIFLPGITGSTLERDGRPVWDISPGALARGVFSRGGSISDLALDSPSDQGADVRATQLIPNVHLVPYLWKIDGYSGFTNFLQKRCGVIKGKNFFEFPYDWRLDNRIIAQRLETAAKDLLSRWVADSGAKDAKLILIGHSMGGLVARYFLEVLGGWSITKQLITLGTPHRGSVNSLDFLCNGLKKKVGPLTLLDLSELLSTFPSVHQLLPIYTCIDEGDGKLKKVADCNTLPRIDMAMAKDGLKFHAEIKEAQATNQNLSRYDDFGYMTHPIVGTYQPTLQSARLDGSTLKMLKSRDGVDHGGDGTVPRVSATPIELSKDKREVFAACQHAGIQNSRSVRVQVRAVLEDIDLTQLKAAQAGFSKIKLDVDDLYGENESVQIKASSDEGWPLEATVANLETKVETAIKLETGRGDWQVAEIQPLAAGVYRVSVTGGEETEPVSDVFLVA